MRVAPLAAAVAALFVANPATAADSAPAPTVLHCAHLIDTDAGKLLGASTIVIDGERVREVRSGRSDVAGATTIDLDGTCLPGLIDSHTHLTSQLSPQFYTEQFRLNPADYAIRSVVYAKRTLEAGFTTVRNLGDNDYNSVSLRNAINAGMVVGPRIFTAGTAIGSSGGHADGTNGYRQDLAGDPGPKDGIVNSVEDAWKAVRLHYKANVDVIKIMPSGGVLDEGGSADNAQMTLDEVKAIVAAAHDYGFTVAAHAHGAEGIRRAVAGGVDSVEHGTFLDDADIKLMKEHGTWLVPTIIAGKTAQEMAEKGGMPPQVAEKAKKVGPLIQATAGRAYKAGVKIAFGTDAGVYAHGNNAKEFVYMVEAGMPPMFVIQAATTHAAQLLRRDKDLGSISAGKFADVIAVQGNPLDDVALLQKVGFVMKAGKVYKRDGVETPALAASGETSGSALPGE